MGPKLWLPMGGPWEALPLRGCWEVAAAMAGRSATSREPLWLQLRDLLEEL